MEYLTIGKLAKLTGMNTETIRYYERRKLIPRPPSSASGYRQYGEKDISRLVFIRRCLRAGFSLDEIECILKGHQLAEDNKSSTLGSIKNAITDRQTDLEHLLGALNSMLIEHGDGEVDIIDRLMPIQRWQQCPEDGN